MGDVKPWSMGEKPMCCHLVVSMPSSLVNLFNVLILLVGGSYCMRERGHGKTWVWQAAVSLDSTHAQQRTLVSLTPGRFLILTVGSFSPTR